MRTSALLTSLLFLGLISHEASATNSVWLRNEGKATGNGCRAAADTIFVAYGDEADIIFNTFAVSLTGDGTTPGSTTDRNSNKECKVSLPLMISPGLFIAELNERMDFGIIKSVQSTGSFESRAWFHGLTLSSMALQFGAGERNEPTLSEERGTLFGNRAVFCSHPSPQGTKGFYNNQMKINGRRPTLNDSIIVAAQGLSLRWHLVARLESCQSP
jgi:hypothetical protein